MHCIALLSLAEITLEESFGITRQRIKALAEPNLIAAALSNILTTPALSAIIYPLGQRLPRLGGSRHGSRLYRSQPILEPADPRSDEPRLGGSRHGAVMSNALVPKKK